MPPRKMTKLDFQNMLSRITGRNASTFQNLIFDCVAISSNLWYHSVIPENEFDIYMKKDLMELKRQMLFLERTGSLDIDWL